MLLLSPALIWHWLPGEGGPEAAAAARPRPPGIFERCSGCLEDGRRGRGGWAGPPNPPPGAGRGGGRAGEGGGGRRGWPLSGRPRRPGEPAQPRARPRRQPSPRPGGAALGAMSLRRPGGPARHGHRGRIVPAPGPRGSGRWPAPSVLPGWGEGTGPGAPPPGQLHRPPSLSLAGSPTQPREAVPPRPRARAGALNRPCVHPSGRLTPGPHHLPRPRFPQPQKGRGGRPPRLRAAGRRNKKGTWRAKHPCRAPCWRSGAGRLAQRACRPPRGRVQGPPHPLQPHRSQLWPAHGAKVKCAVLQASGPPTGLLTWRFYLAICQMPLASAEGIRATSVRPLCLPKSLPWPFTWPGTCCPRAWRAPGLSV